MRCHFWVRCTAVDPWDRFALRNATSRSLIVIDEFGKGTDSNDGAGLFWGAIEHLIRHGPHTVRPLVCARCSGG